MMTKLSDDEVASIRIQRLFPTPLASIVFPDYISLNGHLKTAILARERVSCGVQHSNSGGWQSRDDFLDWSGDAGSELISFGRAFANALSAISHPDSGLLECDIDWKVNAWANINRAGHSNVLHAHHGAYWSGIYWVDDGQDNSVAIGGDLEFQDPRGPMPSMLSPHLRFKIEGCLSAGLTHHMQPINGTFVMFPSWLLHAVTTYIGTRPRISVAMNLAP